MTHLGAVEDSGSVPHLPFGRGAVWLPTTTLFSGLGSEVRVVGEESGMQWENFLFELRRKCRGVEKVMSSGPDERA